MVLAQEPLVILTYFPEYVQGLREMALSRYVLNEGRRRSLLQR